MAEFTRQIIGLVESHPFGALAAVVAGLIYLNLMLSGPRAY